MSNDNVRCSICNKYMDFYMHDCGKTFAMYYGCRVCDDHCKKCLKVKKDKKDDNNKWIWRRVSFY